MQYAILVVGLALVVFNRRISETLTRINRQVAGKSYASSRWVIIAVGGLWVLLAILNLVFGPNLRIE